MMKSRTQEIFEHGQELTPPEPDTVPHITLRGALMCLSALLVIAGTIGLVRGLL